MKAKKTKWIISAIVLALLLPLAFGTGIEEIYGILSGSSFSSLSSYVTFYNVKNEKTSLYVRKEVENASENYPAPEEDEFGFVLSLNGNPVSEAEYRLYDKDGRRIYVYSAAAPGSVYVEPEEGGSEPPAEEYYQTTEKDDSKMEVALKTGRSGEFTLKAGQTAEFPDVKAEDSYVITESETTGYTLTSPASEDQSFSGTLPAEGARVTFTNMYTKGMPGTLEVRKRISYPENYELPETPEFTFAVKIAGKKLADTEYTIKDIASKTVIDTGRTDTDGRFTLKGNTYAVFEDIPRDVDYFVEEIMNDSLTGQGWRGITGSVQEGATTDAGTVVEFANVQASFAVSKDIYGNGSSEDVFTFQVTDGPGKNAYGRPLSYYLYDKTLKLLNDGEMLQTDENGYFTLTGGQRAVFVGLAKGETYGVRETDTGVYTQYLPVQGRYTNKTVQDSVEVLPFVNAVVTSRTQLTVRKTLTDKADKEGAPDVPFTFRISRKVSGNGDDAVYEPLKNAAYDIRDSSGAGTYTTDAEGLFTLHAWETAQFIGLQKGVTYRVEEVTEEIPVGFSVSGEGIAEGVLGDENLKIEIKNTYGHGMPSIGGMGTMVFYIIGGGLIAAAGIVFDVRRRKKRVK